MVAVAVAAEAGGDWQECPVKEAVHVEEGALELVCFFIFFTLSAGSDYIRFFRVIIDLRN